MDKIVVVSQKGGPGKTTTAVNLGAGLALTGERVLVVDVEPQAQAGIALGIRLDKAKRHLSLGLKLQAAAQGVDVSLDDIVIDRTEILSKWRGHGRLAVVASEQFTMANAQHILHAEGKGAVGVLRDLLDDLDEQFDYAVIDTPPAVEALNAVALAASDYAVTLCLPKHATVEGAVAMRSTIKHVRERTGIADPKYLGAILNMSAPPSEWTSEEIEVRNLMVDVGLMPFVTDIRDDTRISRSYDSGVPSVIGFARHACGKRYAELLQEVLDRMDSDESEWAIAPTADQVLGYDEKEEADV
ncbi:ParA family protein [Streptomyces nanshensis]|uniref:Cobyrinic acid a,c-diamide synthase n=1 Tax=Streptomyces nanshensis TaxID=518642 RepID=A0A1E7L8W8_9ACTN|nr:ParA family protein [Streptomyces nanshensis]OEV12588.1 cobyrinic acid a,c-diamide synthase [Streptomyces nanshensis]